jgi:hypothetical protein
VVTGARALFLQQPEDARGQIGLQATRATSRRTSDASAGFGVRLPVCPCNHRASLSTSRVF